MIAQLLVFVRLELRTFWKKPVNLIMLAIFGLMSMGFVAGGVRIAVGSSDTGGAKLAINSPANLLFVDTVLFALMLPFFVAVACGMPILTDFDRRIHRLIFSTPIPMVRYAFARLLGALAVLMAILLAWKLVQAGLYQLWPIDPNDATRVAFQPLGYLWPLVLTALPQMLFVAGVSMWLGVRTRQPVLVFAMPVVILLAGVFFLWTFRPEWLPLWADRLLMMVEPTGFRWLTRTFINEDRGVAFYNNTWITPDPAFALSRVGFVLVGLLGVWAAGRRLARSESQDQRIPKAAALLAEAEKAASTPGSVEQAAIAARGGPIPATVRAPGFVAATWCILRQETRFLLRSPGVWLFGPLILLQVWGTTSFRPGTLDTEALVTTGTAAGGAFNTITLLLCFLTLFYTVESLVREERCGLSSMFRASAAPTGAMLAGKSLANAVMALVIVVAASLGIGLVLLIQGIKTSIWVPFEFPVLFVLFGVLLVPTLIVWCSFVSFLYAVVRNRFVVYGLALGTLVGTGFATRFGGLNWVTGWHLWGAIQWSELDRLEFMWTPLLFNRVFVLALAAFFIAAALAIWPRRTPDLRAIYDRVRPRPMLRALRVPLLVALPVAVLATYAGLKVRAGYEGKPKRDEMKAYWKRNSRTWEDAPFASLDKVDADVKLFPETRSMQVAATYTLRNPHATPMAEIPLTFGLHMKTTDWTIDGVSVDPTKKDQLPPCVENRSGLFVVRPAHPLATNETVAVSFRSEGRFPDGWSRFSAGAGEFVLPTGVVLTSFSPSFLPVVGFVEGAGVDDKNARDAREYPLDYWKQRVDPLFGPAWTTSVRMAVEGPADWTLNVVGVEKESSEADGRRRTVWETDHPVRFFNIVGGPLSASKGETSTVFYDPRTPANVPTMVKALDAARARYSEWFGPYPWTQLRVTQFPGLAGYAQGFPGNISFSEAIGFLTRPSDDKDEAALDSAFYIVAHESGHQWWGNILTPGKGPGGNIISEGLAEFSAAMLIHHEKGEAQRRVLMRRWENMYANGRSADSERPINRTDGTRTGDTVVTYNRAGFVFWMLREVMGEEAMLAGMKSFVAKWKDGVPTDGGLDFPLIEDFVAALRGHAPDQARFDAFVDQWIYGKALPEFKVDNVVAEKSGDGSIVHGSISNAGTGNVAVTVRVQGEASKTPGPDGTPPEPPHQDVVVQLTPGAASEFSVPVSFTPAKVVVDPEVMVLQIGRKRTEKTVTP